MSSPTVQKLEGQVEAVQTAKREQKFFLSEVTGTAVAGFGVGYMETKNPELAKGIGPGKKLKLDHVVALGGLYMGRKKGKFAAMARGAGLGATYAITRGAGIKAATPPKP